jgi:hypothetical protein
MKKLILAVCVTACAVSVFAQGTIVFGNHIANSVVAPIFGPEPGNPGQVIQGNTANGFPVGTTVYTGLGLGTHPTDFMGTFTVELWAGTSAASLAPVAGAQASLITLGFFATAGTPVAIPGIASGSTATLELRAWDNKGGTITTWAAAVAAGDLAGQSAPFTSAALGGGPVPPPNLVGLTSFNVHAVPEPTVFALAGLGAAALLIFRRRK